MSSQHPRFLRLCQSLVALALRVSEVYPARVIVMECWTWGAESDYRHRRRPVGDWRV